MGVKRCNSEIFTSSTSGAGAAATANSTATSSSDRTNSPSSLVTGRNSFSSSSSSSPCRVFDGPEGNDFIGNIPYVDEKDIEGLQCGTCEYGYCVFQIPECKHAFHCRCVPDWPLSKCPTCNIQTNGILVLQTRNCDRDQDIPLRTGKWIQQEIDFMNGMLTMFLDGQVFCANGTSLRNILSKVLNCSPMRLSKRFQKNALGKHTFLLPKSRKISLDQQEHTRKQIDLSTLEDNFYTAIANSKKKSSQEELRNLRKAVQRFWSAQLLEFARHLRQPVVGYGFHIQTKKRRKSSSKCLRPVIRTTKQTSLHGSVFRMKRTASEGNLAGSSHRLTDSSRSSAKMNKLEENEFEHEDEFTSSYAHHTLLGYRPEFDFKNYPTMHQFDQQYGTNPAWYYAQTASYASYPPHGTLASAAALHTSQSVPNFQSMASFSLGDEPSTSSPHRFNDVKQEQIQSDAQRPFSPQSLPSTNDQNIVVPQGQFIYPSTVSTAHLTQVVQTPQSGEDSSSSLIDIFPSFESFQDETEVRVDSSTSSSMLPICSTSSSTNSTTNNTMMPMNQRSLLGEGKPFRFGNSTNSVISGMGMNMVEDPVNDAGVGLDLEQHWMSNHDLSSISITGTRSYASKQSSAIY